MNIKGIGIQGITNLYNKNSVKRVNDEEETKAKDKDTVEISSLGKSLCAYDVINIDNRQKVQELRQKVSSGTYDVNAKLTAESIVRNFQKNN